MALDTRNKRGSALNVGSPWRGILPEPDGAISLGDRQTVVFLYAGIEAGAGSESPVFELIVYVQMPASLSKTVQMPASVKRYAEMTTGV
jgi:hypothetical protein